MQRYKLKELLVGEPWPKYAIYEEFSFKSDLEELLEARCNKPSGIYYNNHARFKEERQTYCEGEPASQNYWVIVIDLEPETNEFGEVSP